MVILIWMMKVHPKPGRYFIERYPLRVLIVSGLPFMKKWKDCVKKEDFDLFKNYYFRRKVLILSLFIPMFLYYGYEFVKSILILQSLNAK